MNESEFTDYRIRFRKTWGCRFMSHLDLMRGLGRAMRRAGLPIYFTQGFNPRPKMSYLTPPLSVGQTSDCEVIDLRLNGALGADDVRSSLEAQMPPGIAVAGTDAGVAGGLGFTWLEYLIYIDDNNEGRNYFDAVEGCLHEQPVEIIERGSSAELRRTGVPADCFNRVFSVKFRHDAAGGSPVKLLGASLVSMDVAFHFHRVGFG